MLMPINHRLNLLIQINNKVSHNKMPQVNKKTNLHNSNNKVVLCKHLLNLLNLETKA